MIEEVSNEYSEIEKYPIELRIEFLLTSGEVLSILETHIIAACKCNKVLFRAVISEQAACQFNFQEKSEKISL